MQILEYIALTIGVVGAGVITWGVILAVLELIRLSPINYIPYPQDYDLELSLLCLTGSMGI